MKLSPEKRDQSNLELKIEKELREIFEAAENPFEDDLQEAIQEALRIAKEQGAQHLDDTMFSDCIVEALISIGCYEEARCYLRGGKEAVDSGLIDQLDTIAFQPSADVPVKRENANINGDTPMGVMLRFGSEAAKELYLSRHIAPRYAKAHVEGDIHIHDLDFYAQTTTCMQIDLLKLFHGGFSTCHGMLREPQSIQSYAALACIAIQSNQNNQHGGQSIPNFDYAMAEGVGKSFRRNLIHSLRSAINLLDRTDLSVECIADMLAQAEQDAGVAIRYGCQNANTLTALQCHMGCEAMTDDVICAVIQEASETTERETYQAMEALIHNLNTMHSRAGAQVPFSSINYGMDTSAEGRLAVRSLLLATQAGLGGGETPIFPVQIFRVKDGVSYRPGDTNYDLFKLAIRTSAQRLFPNFAFMDAPFNAQYYRPGCPETEIAYMGCRTRVMGNTYDPEREISYGRGNLSFTSINLPRLALESGQNISRFFTLLDEKMELVRDQLLERMELQMARKARNYPFLMGQGVWLDSEKSQPDDPVGDVLKHGTLSIGFIGLAETLKVLTGKHHAESTESQMLGLSIIRHMRAFTDRCCKEWNLNFSLLATPAEGLAGRFVALDRKRYGVIPGVTDRAYYTNSFHVPVYCPISAYKKIRLEAPYHELTNGGHISYVEMDGDPLQNLEAFEAVIRCMHDAGIGYGSINHPVDRDPVCGYTGIISDACPKCGRTDADPPHFERIRRITGYLVGTLDRFNDAKRAEEHDRVKHGIATR